MHPHNHYYGHAHVLARYCGSSVPPRVRGYLQPDWPSSAPPDLFGGAWQFLWSGPAGRNQHVIGAPWVYLQELEPDSGVVERAGTLWFFHGWGGGKMPERLIAEIRETEPGPVTVALSPREYQVPGVRAFYADAGFDVLRLGARGWNYDGTDPDCLPALLAELRKRERVASNRLSTAVFYGIAAGCHPTIYGSTSPSFPVSRRAGASADASAFPLRRPGSASADASAFPLRRRAGAYDEACAELSGKEIDMNTAREIADRELGTAWRLPPDELRLLFDWRERV